VPLVQQVARPSCPVFPSDTPAQHCDASSAPGTASPMQRWRTQRQQNTRRPWTAISTTHRRTYFHWHRSLTGRERHA